MRLHGTQVLAPPASQRGGAGADTLSAVLRAVRLTGAVFFTVDAAAPWVAEAPTLEELVPRLGPRVEHVMQYYLVVSGGCFAGVVGEPPVALEAGDVVFFPRGGPHVISSSPSLEAGSSPRATSAVESPRARVICGFLGCEMRPFGPLLATLPSVIHVPRRDDGHGTLEQLVYLALSESTGAREGRDCALGHLSELLFVEVVRRHVSSLPPGGSGWLAGLRDDGVGRALGELHARPEQRWTLHTLAREVGMSRAVLAERFRHFVGVPPMQYLMQWRMQLAATLLTTTSLGLPAIAERVGYGSETALSHAYKRWAGVSPGDFRRRQLSRAPAESLLDERASA